MTSQSTNRPHAPVASCERLFDPYDPCDDSPLTTALASTFGPMKLKIVTLPP